MRYTREEERERGKERERERGRYGESERGREIERGEREREIYVCVLYHYIDR